LGVKHFVPCDPVKYFNFEYGDGLELKNLEYLNDWTREQWPYVVRYYDINGKVDLRKTLNIINKYYRYNLTELPN
jgi:hypothetical protein